MNTLVIRPNTSVYVRINNDVIYVNFESEQLFLYDIDSDDYHSVTPKCGNSSTVIYNILAGKEYINLSVNYDTRQIIIGPVGLLKYFEYEEEDTYATV